MKDGGQAFPGRVTVPGHAIETGMGTQYEPEQAVYHTGMSLRDWFAGMALQGLIADEGYSTNKWPFNLVLDAYKIADAMIAEREK